MNEQAQTPLQRGDFRYFRTVQTRWEDTDAYGHVNNVVYYSYFDTTVTGHLCDAGLLEYRNQEIYGIVVETQCRFLKELAFPETVEVGLRVSRLGRTAVTYDVGIFRRGEDDPAALGRFTHVYVQRGKHRPVPIPDPVRAHLAPLTIEA